MIMDVQLLLDEDGDDDVEAVEIVGDEPAVAPAEPTADGEAAAGQSVKQIK